MVSNDINEEFSILQNMNPENKGLLSKYTDNISTAILINGISKWIIIYSLYHYNYAYDILKTIIDTDDICEYTIIFLLSIFVPTYIFSSGYILAANIEVKAFKNEFNLD
ncbi:uncharacterized protein CMU_022650 [Cryptosporidium muris RN66]|uniref:Uncharacterized protein n=1 Tax=Cryptosporidium muris (strain RN66) TaxID=441375 RepID=B6ABQ7_CRYMR|nr:uncharacterized protein CMU_022650 [Cryptosporidium muris RN66]EEA05260.1 hypothetical protein CMU_022650 [Cryptosporidium muris RN66]|eukprot:XP_002139609.1 hypothetical protein [Cryptosporidium muris RN66]